MGIKKFALRFAAIGLCSLAAEAQAATYLLKFYNVDDDMSAYITNSDYSQSLLFSKGFGQDYPYVDISPYVRNGINTLSLMLSNGPKGYTYGYDFKIDNVTYASGSCGIFNTYGCNADSYDQGLVWSTNIRFKGNRPTDFPGVSGAVPEPASWAMMIIGFGAIGAFARKSKEVGSRIRMASGSIPIRYQLT